MELKLACADYTFPLLTHDQAIKLVALLGFRSMDIGLFEERSHLQPTHVLPHLAASARELSHKLADNGLDFAGIFYQTASFQSMSANHPDPAERARGRDFFLRMLEFTLRCNASHMTGLPGIEWDGVPSDTSLKRAADELSWRAEQARSVGVAFSVEAHVGSIAPTPQKALELVTLSPGLTLTLDYTHYASRGYPDSDSEPLISHASHFHARGARQGRLQAPFKENVIDYARIVRTMKQVNYPGFVVIEYVWQDWEHNNEVDNVSETVMMRDHIIQSFNQE